MNEYQGSSNEGDIVFKREKAQLIIGTFLIILAVVFGGTLSLLSLYGLTLKTERVDSVLPTLESVTAEFDIYEEIHRFAYGTEVPLEKRVITGYRFVAGVVIGFTLFLFLGGLWYARHKKKFRVTEGKLKLDPEYELRFRAGITGGFMLVALLVSTVMKILGFDGVKDISIYTFLTLYIITFVYLFATLKQGRMLRNIFLTIAILGLSYEIWLLIQGEIGIIDMIITSSLYVFYFKLVVDMKKYNHVTRPTPV